ncbi:hypothetical protein ILYODFUR_026219 [Ilyodon furcidens]|uniref:Uncharacterized protein n=1 Tax=Ilyodon furcidens TaxID=33524 RepID=A0ABV0VHQ4_9TELE
MAVPWNLQCHRLWPISPWRFYCMQVNYDKILQLHEHPVGLHGFPKYLCNYGLSPHGGSGKESPELLRGNTTEPLVQICGWIQVPSTRNAFPVGLCSTLCNTVYCSLILCVVFLRSFSYVS